eukprot:3130052-Prymnesium_polylepis.1
MGMSCVADTGAPSDGVCLSSKRLCPRAHAQTCVRSVLTACVGYVPLSGAGGRGWGWARVG